MLLFIDECRADPHEGGTPYEVLAGVAIETRDLWNLIQAVQATERDIFGLTLAEAGIEFKGKKLLKKKVYRLAGQSYPIPKSQRLSLCREFLRKGISEANGEPVESRFRDEFTAYGQACLDFVEQILALCSKYRARVFASIVAPNATNVVYPDRLRRDYMVLFRRFGHLVEEAGTERVGLVIFDERDKTQSRQLCQQMDKYFLATGEGQALSARIVPEPFFVHSDLTTAVRLADVVAYILNWGFRIERRMSAPVREEIRPLAKMVFDLSYKGTSEMVDGACRTLYGIVYLDDLAVPSAYATEP